METFDTQIFGYLYIKYGILFYKICVIQFENIFLVVASQNNPFSALGKWKMIFLFKESENCLRKHCYPFQDARLCIIWTYLNKLCHECHHNIRHLAWKSWIFVHGSSFLRTLFQDICRIPSFLFSLETRSHIMTHCEGFPLFWFFSEFFMPISKCGQNWPHDRS